MVLARPDARATGPRALDADAWSRADATFEGRIGGAGRRRRWRTGRPLPDRWPIDHAGLRFLVGCAPSGHTGLFPEQAAHWAWMVNALTLSPESTPGELRTTRRRPTVLNLFAYTGGASVALAAAGARVTHVDASRPAIGWARENAALNGVSTIRWIHEDARRFVDRERRRGPRSTTRCCWIRRPSGAGRPATGSSTVTWPASWRRPSRCSAPTRPSCC